MPIWKGVYYYNSEALPYFIKHLPFKYLKVFKQYINHEYPLDEIESNTCYIYCGKAKPRKAWEIVINTELENIPPVFFDRAWNESTMDHEKAIYLYLATPTFKKHIGFLYKAKNTLILTDFTHNIHCAKLALQIFPEILKKTGLIKPTAYIVFTQKAKGLQAIHSYSPETIITNPYMNEKINIKSDQLFIRACPRQPRHGVMESIIIPNTPLCIKTAIASMFKQAIAHNEPPEVIVQPYINAKANAVIAPGAFIIAPGNDGVTAGKGKQVIIPLPDQFNLYEEIKEKTKLDEFEIEAVATETAAYLVQVRKASNHIKPSPKPKEALPGFTHGRIVNLENTKPIVIEELENIAQLEKIDPKENIVCFHINGNILSHAAAHCRQTGIPYVVLTNSKIPTKGYLWEVTKGWVKITETPPDKTAKYDIDWNWLFFLTGLDMILQGKLSIAAIKHIWNNITIFHYYLTGTATSEWNAYLAGTFAGALIKTTLAICIGEARHAEAKCYNSDGKRLAKALLKATIGKEQAKDRTPIYTTIFKQEYDLETIRNIGKILQVLFQYSWSESYGGPKWEKIANTIVDLPDLLNTRAKTLAHLNAMLNLCHNNNWAYDKLIDKNLLNQPYNVQDGEIDFALIEGIMLGYLYGIKPYTKGEKLPKKIIVKEGE